MSAVAGHATQIRDYDGDEGDGRDEGEFGIELLKRKNTERIDLGNSLDKLRWANACRRRTS